MTTEQNKALVRRYLEVWGPGQTSTLRDTVSGDVVDHNPAPGQPCGLEGQEWAVQAFRRGISNGKLTIDHLVADGNRVVDNWTYSGTHSGDFFGLPATNKTFTITGSDECRIENGRIAEVWHHEDMASLLQQVGLAPTPPLPQSFGRPGGRSTSSGPTLSRSQMEARMREAFRELIDRGNLDHVAEFATSDYSGHFSAFPPVYGVDGLQQFLSIYINGLSDRHTDVEDILIDGDMVAVRVTYHGKNTGPMLGMPATGKTVAIGQLTVFRMAGDKAVEQWANNDDMGMMIQLGAMPEMGAVPAMPC